MQIKSARVKNFKSFIDSGKVEFSPGFNVIVGKNNSGKTALLQALKLNFENQPYKSSINVAEENITIFPPSTVTVNIVISGVELKRIFRSIGQGSVILVAQPYGRTELLDKSILEEFFAREEIEFKFNISQGQISYDDQSSPYHYQVAPYNGSVTGTSFIKDQNLEWNVNGLLGGQFDFSQIVFDMLRSEIYMFNAERLNISSSQFGQNSVLNNNASNLPEVLNYLQGNNPTKYKMFVNFVREIFSSIKNVSVRVNGAHFEIVTWQEEEEYQRPDLAIPLSSSGTGVGQVLAILYVVINSSSPRTIIIDEPNSFLHPGAVRSLISILKRYPQHQYILTTHSPDVVKFIENCSTHLVVWDDLQSHVESLDPVQTKNYLKILREVGARLSDVFGADNVIWVEGETEEYCFNQILVRLVNSENVFTIAPVMQVGDFDNRKRVKMISEIYNKLSTTNGLIPMAIGFIFDKEDRTEQEIKELIRESSGRIHFLDRRLYENYLLNIEGITCILNSLTAFRENPIRSEAIVEWIESNGTKPKYINNFAGKNLLNDQDWIARVHAAKLLDDMFDYLSDHKHPYEKTTHSFLLTDWIIENSPASLLDLVNLLRRLTVIE